MSYYLAIISPLDQPLYEADLHSKPALSSGTSFFSPAAATAAAAAAASTPPPASSSSQTVPADAGFDSFTTSGTGLFGFGAALSSLTSGLQPTPPSSTAAARKDRSIAFSRFRERHVLQMVAHSALDPIEDTAATNQGMYLKLVDRINEWWVSAWVGPGAVKFVILHEHRHDEGIRSFFTELWESWLKISLNPFFDPNSPVTSPSFDVRVKACARKHL